MVVAPVFQIKLVPLVVTDTFTGEVPHTVVILPVTVTGGCANTLTVVVTEQIPDVKVTG